MQNTAPLVYYNGYWVIMAILYNYNYAASHDFYGNYEVHLICGGLDHTYLLYSFSVEHAQGKESTAGNRCCAASPLEVCKF